MEGTPGELHATMMLCDAAQVVADKLYILGGAWSYIWLPQAGMQIAFAVALDIAVPWDMANRPLSVSLRLLTEDHEEVIPPNGVEPIRAEGNIVAGRPHTARAGTDLHVPMVIPFAPLVLEPGGYICELQLESHPVARSSFQVALVG
jgi:hypothetical protein